MMNISSVTVSAALGALLYAFAKWFKRTDFDVSFHFKTRSRR
jgi:hypothetical protein